MVTLIVFIIILGLLVFVHELGHFVIARSNGVRAYEFGFGFPPRVVGVYKNEEGKWRIVWGSKHIEAQDTIYSLNAIPLGGFVKIKGEDGGEKSDPDSFASKGAWTRIKILLAGVTMNFLLAWILLSLVFAVGAPQERSETESFVPGTSKIQIYQILPDSPAEAMGIRVGDELLGCENGDAVCGQPFVTVNDVQTYIKEHKGSEIALRIKRGEALLTLKGTPRAEFPENQGPLGISLVETVIVRYPWYQALVKGAESLWNIMVTIVVTFGQIIGGLFVGKKMAVDVSGPVGIAYLTKQVTELGFTYILQFAAILSINLGIINAIPFPALDGGRVLFILIEKIKGSPVSQKVEQIFHTVGFALLILLMILVTFRDVAKFELIDKVKNIF